MVRKFLFAVATLFMGFKFYMSTIRKEDTIFQIVDFNFNHGKPFTFHFYRSVTEYFVHRFGIVHRREIVKYGIAPAFDEQHPELMKDYHSRMMVFLIPFHWLLDERMITQVILRAYVEYLHVQMKRSHERTT